MSARFLAGIPLGCCALLDQPPARGGADALAKSFQARSSSSLVYSGGGEGERTVEITNVSYELSGDSVSGRPAGSRLVLRTTVQSKQVVGDKGIESSVAIEAWPLGVDLKQKPHYTLKVPGVSARTVAADLWLIDRNLEADVSWWSVYKLGTGEHLFDTYVELLRFTVSREDGSPRYAGLEVPPDDAASARLKDRRVVAVLTYASGER